MNGKHNGWPIDSSNKYYTSKSAPCGRILPSARWAQIRLGAFSFIKRILSSCFLFYFTFGKFFSFYFGKMQLFILLLVAMLLSFDLHLFFIDLLNKNNCLPFLSLFLKIVQVSGIIVVIND